MTPTPTIATTRLYALRDPVSERIRLYDSLDEIADRVLPRLLEPCMRGATSVQIADDLIVGRYLYADYELFVAALVETARRTGRVTVDTSTWLGQCLAVRIRAAVPSCRETVAGGRAMATTAPVTLSAASRGGAEDPQPLVEILDARVLRAPHFAHALNDGPSYIYSDIEMEIGLCGIALPPITLTVCSGSVLWGAPIGRATWPTLDWIYGGEGSAFFDSLRTRSSNYVIELEDLREAVLDAAQWHPLVRSACREVGRMIEGVLKRGLPERARQR